jgi:hypothetical protein
MDLRVNSWTIICAAIGSFVISYMMALCFYLVFERPIKNILDLVLFPDRNIYIIKDGDTSDRESEDEIEQDDGVSIHKNLLKSSTLIRAESTNAYSQNQLFNKSSIPNAMYPMGSRGTLSNNF